MGKRLDKVYMWLKKWYYRYNAENRAYSYIDKEKLPLSPRHPGTENVYDEIRAETSDTFKKLLEKNPKLDKHLQTVYVTSQGKNEDLRTNKPLPQNRFSKDTGYIFLEPAETQEGYATLSHIVKFITDHNGDPKLWSAESVAKSYKLEKNKVDNVLKYYKTFNLYVQDLETEENVQHLVQKIAPVKSITGKPDSTNKDSSTK